MGSVYVLQGVCLRLGVCVDGSLPVHMVSCFHSSFGVCMCGWRLVCTVVCLYVCIGVWLDVCICGGVPVCVFLCWYAWFEGCIQYVYVYGHISYISHISHISSVRMHFRCCWLCGVMAVFTEL